MERENLEKRAWERFTDTGKVGAYLLYCAIRGAAEKRG